MTGTAEAAAGFCKQGGTIVTATEEETARSRPRLCAPMQWAAPPESEEPPWYALRYGSQGSEGWT